MVSSKNWGDGPVDGEDFFVNGTLNSSGMYM